MNELSNRTTGLIASEINSIKEQTQKIFLLNSIEIGKRLVEAKQLLPHGEWGKWLEVSVNYSQRTANNLMKIYEEYGQDQLALEGAINNSQAIAKINYTQAVALLSIPSDEREDFINEHDLESMSTRELQQAIKEKKELEEKLKLSEEAAEQEKKEREKLLSEFKEIEERSGEHQEKINELKERLKAAENKNDEEEIDRLNSSLRTSEQALKESKIRIESLEKQLKEKPIEVAAVVEHVPEDIQKELEELRKKVSSELKGENVAKFKFHFESLVKGFDDILDTLNSIEDPEASGKLKKAVKGLLEKMQDEL
jgi:chromosome segregation ATPase